MILECTPFKECPVRILTSVAVVVVVTKNVLLEYSGNGSGGNHNKRKRTNGNICNDTDVNRNYDNEKRKIKR